MIPSLTFFAVSIKVQMSCMTSVCRISLRFSLKPANECPLADWDNRHYILLYILGQILQRFLFRIHILYRNNNVIRKSLNLEFLPLCIYTDLMHCLAQNNMIQSPMLKLNFKVAILRQDHM